MNVDAMNLSIDSRSEVPIYVQIKNQIRLAVEQGAVRTGQQLPTVRVLAVELSINPNTVQRVYADLEREGYLKRMRGIGTFAVDPREQRSAEQPGRAALAETLRQLRTLGYGRRQILELAAELLDETG